MPSDKLPHTTSQKVPLEERDYAFYWKKVSDLMKEASKDLNVEEYGMLCLQLEENFEDF